MTGRCLCGAVRYAITGALLRVVHCHCDSCRRQTASPVATFLILRAEDFRVTAGAVAEFRSSPPVRRGFCPGCGSPIYYRTDARADMVDVFIGTLDDPAAVRPDAHVHAGEQLPWFELHDTLPRYAQGSTNVSPIRHGPAPTQGSPS